MGFYDKDKLRGILDDVRNPDAWAAAIDNLPPPKLKHFDVAHNRYHLQHVFKAGIPSFEHRFKDQEVPKTEIASFIVKMTNYFNRNDEYYSMGARGSNQTLDHLAIESLRKFARDLGIAHLVSAAQSAPSDRTP